MKLMHTHTCRIYIHAVLLVKVTQKVVQCIRLFRYTMLTLKMSDHKVRGNTKTQRICSRVTCRNGTYIEPRAAALLVNTENAEAPQTKEVVKSLFWGYNGSTCLSAYGNKHAQSLFRDAGLFLLGLCRFPLTCLLIEVRSANWFLFYNFP